MPQFNIRDLPERTAQQISELAERHGYTKTQLVIIAIDRLYQQERDHKMNCYSIQIDPEHGDSLAFMRRLDPDAPIEYVDTAADGSEVWHVTTERDIDTILDQQPGIIGYSVGDPETPQYVKTVNK